VSDYNARTIEEFRANHGIVGGDFEGKPLLILHSKGARSGAPHVNPLMYQKLEKGFAVFASKGGAPNNPDWFYNLIAYPAAHVEVGDESYPVVARVAEPDERAVIWEKQKREYPQFAGYEEKTHRTIPVVLLEIAS
jgi:deazaflavin-dependent oxidoreductase (nitroreductase family)